jgi:hypothetical protein
VVSKGGGVASVFAPEANKQTRSRPSCWPSQKSTNDVKFTQALGV